MNNYFTSDWHLGEDRIGVNGKPNLFYRPFKSVEEQDNTIVAGIAKAGFKNGDTLYHLGDVVYDQDRGFDTLGRIRYMFNDSKFILVKGNYDINLDKLSKYFDEIHESVEIELPLLSKVYMNHYPLFTLPKLDQYTLGITGHIHALWKVQQCSFFRNMINVGVDAWHFMPVSEETLAFCHKAMINYYDENVFPCQNQ